MEEEPTLVMLCNANRGRACPMYQAAIFGSGDYIGRNLHKRHTMPGKTPPRKVRVVALLIWFLSKNADLGIAYALSCEAVYDMSDVDLLSAASVVLFLSS